MASIQAAQQQYTQRNVFYLRASPYVVLQTILYLDHRHVDWMNQSPLVLPRVLAILRTRIMPKLRKEADGSGKVANMSKKERVDVYSDQDFQVAYFFRRMDDRHSVLLKEKSLVFPQDPTLSAVKIEDEDGNLHAPIPQNVRTATASNGASTQPTGAVRVKNSPESELVPLNESDAEPSVDAMTDEILMPPPLVLGRREREAHSISDDEDEAPSTPASLRRSKRARNSAPVKGEPGENDSETQGEDVDVEYDEERNAAIPMTAEDEEKMKPKLQVKYAGFRIFGKLLVLVIEPSKRTVAANPSLFGDKTQAEIRQLSVAPLLAGQAGSRSSSARQGSVQTRFTSLEPASERSSSRNASLSRGPTPLFRGVTPADSDVGSPAPRSSFGTPGFDREHSVDLTDEDDDDEGQATVGQLEGFDLATQMLEREEQTSGGNDIEEGD